MDGGEPRPAEAETTTSSSTAYIPPSVDVPAILSGASYTYLSPIPAKLLPDPVTGAPGVPCALGVDEAGRGPVLGPMVYGVFFLPVSQSETLLRDPAHRFDDSKVLTPAFRESLMRQLCTPSPNSSDASTTTMPLLSSNCAFAIRSLSARDIAAGMMRPAEAGGAYNLNAQAVDATVELIRLVCERGVDVREIYVDTVGPPATYQARLARLFPTAKVTVAKKADSLYPCVSAASVCAKVTRDAALDVLLREHVARQQRTGRGMAEDDGNDDDEQEKGWGSGYPSDARCVAWMKRNMHPVFGWGDECRFSWGTAKELLEGKGNGAVEIDWPVDNDNDNMRLTEYFGARNKDEADELGNWYGAPVGLESF